jgi:pyruvate kinase
MLESMVNNPRPTRAECSDVANAVYDGTDVVMLSGETANGPYFQQAVQVMAKTCCEAESSRNYNFLYQSIRNSILDSALHLSVGESMASSAVKTALDIQAKLIVVLSETGRMANYIAKFRPSVSVLCMTPNETAARQMSGCLSGMHTVVIDKLDKAEELIEELSYELVNANLDIHIGDSMVVCGGRMAGTKEQIRAERIGEGKKHGHIQSGDTYFFDAKMLFSFVPEEF